MSIWILSGQKNGIINFSTYQILTLINHWKLKLSLLTHVNVIVIGSILDSEFEEISFYGVKQLYVIDDDFNPETIALTISNLINNDGQFLLVSDSSDINKELCGRISALIKCHFFTNVVDLETLETGKCRLIRSIYEGKLWETLEINSDLNYQSIILALEEEAMPEPVRLSNKIAPLEKKCLGSLSLRPSALLVEKKELAPKDTPIDQASVVIAGGRGMGKEGFPLLEKLAERLKGSVGGTRPMVDEMVIPFERQIGQTGKIVRPYLIINAGISGANEYTIGIQKARHSIAINTDPNARIFEYADVAVEGDAKEIIKLVIESLDD